ncbi:MAG: hypothetical protein GTN76_07865 [Candidatus Aenigmarchaeota archaeon]|nr:hypothetical protein [Candidatus Aenigmarchaeota archaeon]
MWGKGVWIAAFMTIIFALLNAQPVLSVNIDNCSVLDTQGETYNLTQDIWNSTNSTCMDVQANDVILDCQGYRIDGVDGGDTYGVFIVNYDNVTVRNCEISDWTYGIYMSSSTDDKIYNNLITSITNRGINAFSSSNYNNFTNNTVYLNNDYGVVFLSSLGNNFSHGNVSNNTNHGFWFSASNNSRIEYTYVGLNTQDGVNFVTTTGNVIYESNVTSNQVRGIYLGSSSGNRIEGGNVKSNGNTGIRFSQSTNNNITGVNSSLNTGYGIYFESSSNGNRVDNAIISDNTLNGLHMDSSSSNVMTGIESYANDVDGIAISASSNNNLTGSYIHSNDDDGVSFSNTDNNYVIDTVISASSDYQIVVTGSSNNYFINSTFDKNDVSVSSSAVIWVKWYLDIQVRDTSETPVANANVSVTDTYNYSWFSGQTNSSGYIPRQVLSEYNQTPSGKSFYTNYTVDVNKTGYPSNQTSENLTTSKLLIVHLQGLGPPVVQVKTYTRALVETSVFKPNRMVRTRASVTSGNGRDYLANATIVIKNNLGATIVNNANMTNVSEIANGYIYEYNYTLPGNAAGLWLVNVTATDDENRRNHDFKKIAVVSLNFQVKILFNNTWDSASIYIPGAGEKTFTQLGQISPYTDVNPPHYYLASYMNNILTSLVVSPDNPLSIHASTGSGNYEMRTDQRFQNSVVFLVFSRGDWRQVNQRIDMIEKGEFLSQISPTFSYGLGNKYPLKIVLSYDNVDINDTLSVGRGYSRLAIENKGATGDKVNLGVERV